MIRAPLCALIVGCSSAAWCQAITDPATGDPVVIDPAQPPQGAQITLLLATSPLVLAQTATDPMPGAPFVIDPSKPPNGMQVVKLFIQNASSPLSGSGCMSTPEMDARLTLGDRLAAVLGDEVSKQHKGVIHISCISDETEAIPGRLVDAWACTIKMEEVDEHGEYIADASVRAHFTKDTWSFVPGTVLCW